MRLPRSVYYYTAAVVLTGLVIAGFCLARYPLGGSPAFLALALAFAALAALSERFGLHLTTGTRVHVGTIPLFATVLVFNPAMAVLIASVGSLAGRIWLGAPLIEHIFNFGQMLIYVGASGIALHLLTSAPWEPSGLAAWLGAAAALVAMYTFNTGVIAGIVALQRKRRVLRVWREALPTDAREQAVMFAFGLLTALIVVPHPWAVLLFAVPSIAVFVTLERTLLMEARQKQLAEQNAGLAAHLSEQAEQLREAYSVVEQALNAKNQMLQNVSHELRTPLVSIHGYTEALQEGLYGPLTANQLSGLDVIYRNSQQLIRLVNDLLSLQSLDRGQLQVADTDVELLFQQAQAVFGPRAAMAKIDLRFSCDPDVPVMIADSSRIEQVLTNLLDNAIKFSPNGGRVQVSARSTDENTVELRVSDQGVGIPADELNKIYDRFYQVDGSSTRRFGGQGLGLAIVKRIVDLHGGSIRAESAMGRGTTFVISLPATAPSAAFVAGERQPA